jgi:hypothetical protein
VSSEARVAAALLALKARRTARRLARKERDDRRNEDVAAFQSFRGSRLLAAVAHLNRTLAEHGWSLRARAASSDDTPVEATVVHLERSATDFQGDAVARFSLEHGTIRVQLRIHGNPTHQQSSYRLDYHRRRYLRLHEDSASSTIDALTDLVVAAMDRLD